MQWADDSDTDTLSIPWNTDRDRMWGHHPAFANFKVLMVEPIDITIYKDKALYELMLIFRHKRWSWKRDILYVYW